MKKLYYLIISHLKKNILILLLTLICFQLKAQEDSIKVKQLSEIKVTSSVMRTLKEKPLNVLVINTKVFYQSNQNSLDILKQNSGVNIRTNGGYGSNADFFINGISGKQIKFFVDGNPIDNLGQTQGINIVPVQQTERFEIYKGVIPIELGTDALGGAVNIVTRKDNKDYLDFSSAYGSFNTYKNVLQLKKFINPHFYIGLGGSYNHSDNDYKVLAEVPDEFGNPIIKNVRRFHNQFTFTNLKIETGLSQLKWANVLSLQFQYAHSFDELQHNVIMRQPYGEALFTSSLKGLLLRYQKVNLLKNLDFNSYFNYNETISKFRDTTLNVYNWEGKVVDRRFTGGEISSSGSLLTTNARVFNTRQILSYYLSENTKINLANTFQYFYRRGEDPVALKFYGNDFFGQAQTMQKNVSGASIETKWLGEKLVNLSSLKYFYARFSGNKREDLNLRPISQTIHRFGYNTAFTYFINRQLFIKTSYEKATRLPDEVETFGDLRLVRPNPNLLPETSDNINLNIIFRSDVIDAELTGFYRKLENIIYLPPSIFYSEYQNILRANIKGIETAVRVRPYAWLNLDANFTFQDLRNKSYVEGYGINNERYKNARLPNIPYIFANAGITIVKDSVLRKKANIQFYWNCNYVHNYYLYWAIDGDPSLKNIIPQQFINHIGFSTLHYKSRISLAVDINNLFDKLLYDNFKVQLPGRTYSIKLRFYHSKT